MRQIHVSTLSISPKKMCTIFDENETLCLNFIYLQCRVRLNLLPTLHCIYLLLTAVFGQKFLYKLLAYANPSKGALLY